MSGLLVGGAEEDRTPDLCIANAALSQLSYGPMMFTDSISSPVGCWGWNSSTETAFTSIFTESRMRDSPRASIPVVDQQGDLLRSESASSKSIILSAIWRLLTI